jgi:hypothetical protein
MVAARLTPSDIITRVPSVAVVVAARAAGAQTAAAAAQPINALLSMADTVVRPPYRSRFQ